MKLLIVADLGADTAVRCDGIAFECPTIRSIDVALLDDCDAALALFAGGQTRFQAQPQARVDDTVGLSPRERSILQLIAEGRSNKEIARSLGIAPETVKSHVKNVFGKLVVERRAQAISRAQSLGLVRTSVAGRHLAAKFCETKVQSTRRQNPSTYCARSLL